MEWESGLICDLHVDSIRSLLVSLNVIKRTQLLTEYNTGDEDVQYLRIDQHDSGKFGGILPFDCKGAITSVAPRWKKWKKSFEYYILAKGITNSARKKGLLLHCAGTEVQELFETLQDPGPPADAGEDNADEYQKALRGGYRGGG